MATKTKTELENELILLQEENTDLKRAKEEFEKALNFANLVKQNITDPQNTSKKSSGNHSRYTKENIENYLQSPATNEKNIRNASKYMWDISLNYRRLILYYSQLPAYEYVISPLLYTQDKNNLKTLNECYKRAANYMEKMNIKHEMPIAAETAFRDGVFYGVVIETKESFFIQAIDPDICVLTSKSDGCWNFSIDCSQIKEAEIDIYYPEIIQELWRNYRDTGVKYQEVPAEKTFCLKADETQLKYSIPYFASIMPQLYMISEYEALQETASEIENYKLIAGVIPMNDDGTPKIDWNLATQYYNHLVNNLPSFIGAAITPFELKEFKFDRSNGISSVDVVSRAVEQYWQAVGSPASIHGAGASTATGLKYATQIDELIALNMVEQIQRAINRLLLNLSGKIKFKVTLLPITRLNRAEMVSLYKEGATFGLSKSFYVAALGMQPFELSNLTLLENDILGFDNLSPLINTYNTSLEEKDNVGRPESDNPSDKTITNKENAT